MGNLSLQIKNNLITKEIFTKLFFKFSKGEEFVKNFFIGDFFDFIFLLGIR